MQLTPVQQYLVIKNKSLAYRIANTYEPYTSSKRIEIEDLYSIALEGLCKASLKYNPSLGIRFVTYAYTTIVRSLMRSIPKYICNLSYPEDIIAPSAKHLSFAKEKFKSSFGIAIDIERIRNLGGPDTTVDEHLNTEVCKQIVYKTLNKMPPERKQILCDYYGINIDEPIPVKQLASQFKVSEHSIYQRIYVAKKHFRKLIGEQIDFYI